MPKAVNDQVKLDRTLFGMPKSWCGGSFIVAFSNKVQSKKIVGKDVGLRKTITALANFEVNPTITITTQEVVFKDEFLWGIGNLDTDRFKIRHGCVQVEVLEIKCGEAGTISGKDTV